MSDVTFTGDARFEKIEGALGRLEGKMDALGRAGGKAGEGAAQGAAGFDSLTGALKSAAVGMAALKAIDIVADLADLGFASEQAAVTLNALTDSAMDFDKAVSAVKAGTSGTVTDLDAMRIASMQLATGMVQSVDGIEQFTRAAATLGKAFRGLDAAESVQLFNQMISNRSIKLLDDFGIQPGGIRRRRYC
jgi:hypothetical protein